MDNLLYSDRDRRDLRALEEAASTLEGTAYEAGMTKDDPLHPPADLVACARECLAIARRIERRHEKRGQARKRRGSVLTDNA